MEQDIFNKHLKDNFNIEVTDEISEKLDKYYNLLIEENKLYNLTNITEKKEVYLKHFFDSLTLLFVVDLNQTDTLCDIGSGAGFPGLVVKIFFPNIKVTLVDARGKRCDFLKKIVDELGLKDITIINTRIEELNMRDYFDITTARAFSNLSLLSEVAIPITKVGGHLISMRGEFVNEETSNYLSKLNSTINKIHKFTLPIEGSKRTLIDILKVKETNSKYPRKFSEIKKKPL